MQGYMDQRGVWTRQGALSLAVRGPRWLLFVAFRKGRSINNFGMSCSKTMGLVSKGRNANSKGSEAQV